MFEDSKLIKDYVKHNPLFGIKEYLVQTRGGRQLFRVLSPLMIK
jgi:hypothetical protein